MPLMHCYLYIEQIRVNTKKKKRVNILSFNLKIVYSEEDSRMFMLSKLHSHNLLNLLKQTV